MKKKDLTKLTVRELIDELKAKAGGVINPNFRLETRKEYRQYLNEILAELEKRDLSEEEKKELEKVFSSPDSEEASAEEEAAKKAAEEAAAKKAAEEEAAKKAAEEAAAKKAAEEAAKKAAEEAAAKKAAEEAAAKKAAEEAAKKAAEEEAAKKAAEEAAAKKAAEEAAKKAAEEAAAKKAAEEEAAKKAAEEAAKKAAEEEAAKKAAKLEEIEADRAAIKRATEAVAAKKAAEEAAAKKAAEEAAAKKAAEEADGDFLDELLKDYPNTLANKKKAAEEAAKKAAEEEAAAKKAAEEDADSFGIFEEEKTESKDKKSVWLVIFGIAVVLCLIIILVMAFVPKKEYNQENEDEVPNWGISGEIDNSNTSTFDISKFNAMCVNLSEYRTDEDDIVGNVYKVTENIGAKKLAELTKKYGETTVANTIVNIVVGGSEVMREAKVTKEGWQYNPNATDDYYKTYMEICETYETKTGKKATVAMDNIEAYKANPGDRAAIEAEIRATGDLDLLTWYQANATASDVLTKQSRDTQLADQYKENVEDELIESESFITILEKVLQKQKTGDFVVIENDQYSKAFKDYIAIEIAAVVGAAE